MKLKTFLAGLIIISSVTVNAQVGLIQDCQYFFGVRPMIGSLKTNSNIADGVNPELPLQAQSLSYGIDLLNATWTYVEGQYLVSQLQVPIRVRYMNSRDNGLRLSDDTQMPRVNGPSFSYLDFGLSFIYSPVYLKMGPIVIAPKIGIGLDMANHEYAIDLSKYIGKTGTNTDLQNQINAVAPEAPIYNLSFWKDIYGVNIGANVNIGQRFIFDFNYDYYPSIFLDRDVQNTIKHSFAGNTSSRISINESILNRLTFEARFYLLSNVALFARYEMSDYSIETKSSITTGGATLLNSTLFYQKNANLLFGVDVVFLQ